MERFVRMSVDEIEALVSHDGWDVDDVSYPPACIPARGPLHMRALEQGGVKMQVAHGELAVDDFRLAVLFKTGSFIFAGSDDLARFFRGPVAVAFGIEVEPLPPRPVAEEEPRLFDEEPEPPPEPRRRKPSREKPQRLPRAGELAARLAREVDGQDDALEIVARAVVNHCAKPFPTRPESIVLLGPTGTGKTSTIEALPEALADLGLRRRHVFRVDCNELVHASDIRRILGAPPSYIGYVEEPPLVEALREPGCILLLDEVEKATEVVFDVFLGLLDDGRITAPDGETVEAPGAIVAMTTNEGADDLVHRLRDVPVGGREEQQACREHLLRAWWSPELVGRLGAFAVFGELSSEAQRGVAEKAIRRLGSEFGVTVGELEPVLADVVWDIAHAGDFGARALTYAARDLLADAFADAARDGVRGAVKVEAGPPPRVCAAG